MIDDRFTTWLHAAKERAALLEQFTPLAQQPTTRKRNRIPMAGDVESWYETERFPIQDPPNLITPVTQWALTVANVRRSVARRTSGEAKQHRGTNKRKAKAA